MKISSYFLVSLFLISLVTNAQEKQNTDDLKSVLKNQMAKISDTSLISKYEVSNKLYNLFLNDLKKSSTSDYLKAKVDSLKWDVVSPALTKYYNTHPSYNGFPVVNISYDGAVLFCKWLKEKYATVMGMKIKELRLPSALEWETAAKGGKSDAVYSWFDTKLFNAKGQPYGQFKGSSEAMTKPGKLNDSWEECVPVKSFKPNSFGLYNMCGNVAEMMLEKGKTKGGAWNSTAEQLKINGPDEFAGFSEPSPFIGFRYIIILEK